MQPKAKEFIDALKADNRIAEVFVEEKSGVYYLHTKNKDNQKTRPSQVTFLDDYVRVDNEKTDWDTAIYWVRADLIRAMGYNRDHPHPQYLKQKVVEKLAPIKEPLSLREKAYYFFDSFSATLFVSSIVLFPLSFLTLIVAALARDEVLALVCGIVIFALFISLITMFLLSGPLEKRIVIYRRQKGRRGYWRPSKDGYFFLAGRNYSTHDLDNIRDGVLKESGLLEEKFFPPEVSAAARDKRYDPPDLIIHSAEASFKRGEGSSSPREVKKMHELTQKILQDNGVIKKA